MVTSAKKINLGMTPASTLVEEAKKANEEWGKTDLYSTGDAILDEYLGNSNKGGYGRKSAYEIITIFGDTGMNKSTFCTSIILNPASKGVPIAYFALEDDPKDVVTRIMRQAHSEEEMGKILDSIMFMPENDGYTLDMMADAIEEVFKVADIVVIDPLQFIFEASVAEKGETEFNRQRLFMRKMNNIMKHTNKTLIIVSHTGKGGGKDSRVGVDRIIGSSAVAQVSTKVIEINRKEDGLHGIRLWKSRFTPYRYCGVQIVLENMRVRTVYEPKDLPQARILWSGGAVRPLEG